MYVSQVLQNKVGLSFYLVVTSKYVGNSCNRLQPFIINKTNLLAHLLFQSLGYMHNQS